MANCRYCGLKAGFFKETHEECSRDAETVLRKLEAAIANAVLKGIPASEVTPTLDSLKQEGRLANEGTTKSLLRAADKAALTLAHEQPASNYVLEQVGDLFSAAQPNFLTGGVNLKDYPGFISLTFSNTLFQILHGETPYFNPSTTINFRLSSDEQPILKRNARLAEYGNLPKGGGSQSISLPIGGGLYYRLSASLPRSEETGLVLLDEGELLITTKAIYFGGLKQALHLPYSSILRLESLADGIGIYQHHGTGKVLIPASLGFDDGWFFYNLIAALTARTFGA